MISSLDYNHGLSLSAKSINIVVVSDTHVNNMKELPHKLLRFFHRADLIIHLGDYISPELLKEFKGLGNFRGIIGNHDSLISPRELKTIDVFEIGGKRLGLIHGLSSPLAMLKRIRALFKKYHVDIILYGHNHLAFNSILDGILYLNPGTVTNQFPSTYGSFGIVSIANDGTIISEIIPLVSSTYVQFSRRQRFIAALVRFGIRCLVSLPYPNLNNLPDRFRTIFNRQIRKSSNVVTPGHAG